MKNFVIIANQRSGSTYLYKLLNNHPEICCLDEIFRIGANTEGNFKYYLNETMLRNVLYKGFGNKYFRNISPNNIVLRRLTNNFLDGIKMEVADPKLNKAFGFKLMYDQFNLNKSLQKWIKKDNVYLIHLIRKNALKIHLSWLTRLKRGIPHSDKYQVPVKVWVDPDTIVNTIEDIVLRQKNIRKKLMLDFEGSSHLEIIYEDMLVGDTVQLYRILEFLNLTNCNVNPPKMKKLNPDSIQSIIENYGQIKDVISQTKYRNFL